MIGHAPSSNKTSFPQQPEPPSRCVAALGPAPSLTRPCHAPCPGDCALAPWSPWTQCAPLCQDPLNPLEGLTPNSANQKRNTSILAQPLPGIMDTV